MEILYYILFMPFAISILLSGSVACYKITEERLKVYNQLGLFPNVSGPESIAFDCAGGGPYTGVSDGRILKWRGAMLGWTDFAYTSPRRTKSACDGSTDMNKEEICGRPLGLHFNKATTRCDLYIADAYFGLLKVGPRGGLATQLVNSAEGVPFKFTNNLDIDNASGSVYFTDTSTVYQRRDYIMVLITGDTTGRLLKYDLKTKKVTVLLKGLPFANGVALSKDKTFLLVSQTTTNTILRYWLKGPKAKTSEILAELNGFPDNIERTADGHFWVALNNGEGSLGNFKSLTYLRKRTATSSLVKVSDVEAAAIKINGNGDVVEVLNEKAGKTVMESVSDVRERNGSLWVGSLAMPCVGLFMS